MYTKIFETKSWEFFLLRFLPIECQKRAQRTSERCKIFIDHWTEVIFFPSNVCYYACLLPMNILNVTRIFKFLTEEKNGKMFYFVNWSWNRFLFMVFHLNWNWKYWELTFSDINFEREKNVITFTNGGNVHSSSFSIFSPISVFRRRCSMWLVFYWKTYANTNQKNTNWVSKLFDSSRTNIWRILMPLQRKICDALCNSNSIPQKNFCNEISLFEVSIIRSLSSFKLIFFLRHHFYFLSPSKTSSSWEFIFTSLTHSSFLFSSSSSISFWSSWKYLSFSKSFFLTLLCSCLYVSLLADTNSAIEYVVVFDKKENYLTKCSLRQIQPDSI